MHLQVLKTKCCLLVISNSFKILSNFSVKALQVQQDFQVYRGPVVQMDFLYVLHPSVHPSRPSVYCIKTVIAPFSPSTGSTWSTWSSWTSSKFWCLRNSFDIACFMLHDPIMLNTLSSCQTGQCANIFVFFNTCFGNKHCNHYIVVCLKLLYQHILFSGSDLWLQNGWNNRT